MQGGMFDYFNQCTVRQHRAVLIWKKSPVSSPQLHQTLKNHQALFLNEVPNYRTYLGTEQSLLFCDLTQAWSWNAFVALSATLKGGGLLCLEYEQLFPSLQNWLEAFEPEGFFSTTASALLAFLESNELQQQLIKIRQPKKLSSLGLTTEQQHIITAIQALQAQQAIFIFAARGRGKSTSMRVWFEQQTSDSKRYVCAPSKQQVSQLLASAPKNTVFLPPDQLDKTQFNPQDFLFVDEAATLPWRAQNALLKFPGKLVLASTTEGYEYAGRGFILRFIKQLKAHFKQVTLLKLTQALRWAADDPLEQATYQAFALYHSSPSALTTQTQPAAYFCHSHANDYTTAEKQQFFQLLTEAHYRTSPNDMGRLLDQASQQIIALWSASNTHKATQNKQLLGVIWLSKEAGLTPVEAKAVMQGKRRLQGQLLAQTYAFYCKNEVLAQSQHARIVRIAVAPNFQQQGIGSFMLQYVEDWAKQQGFATLGTSFGVTKNLTRFWFKNNWQLVRVGHKPDPASRYPSAVLCRALSPLAEQFVNIQQKNLWIHLSFHKNKHPFLFEQLPQPSPTTLNALRLTWQALNEAFIAGQFNFLDYQPWLAAAINYQWFSLEALSKAERSLLNATNQPTLQLSQLAPAQGYLGQKDLLKTLKNICRKLHPRV